MLKITNDFIKSIVAIEIKPFITKPGKKPYDEIIIKYKAKFPFPFPFPFQKYLRYNCVIGNGSIYGHSLDLENMVNYLKESYFNCTKKKLKIIKRNLVTKKQ